MQTLSAKQRLKSNNKFSRKITYKRKQNLELSGQIEDYFHSLGLSLPKSKSLFRDQPERYLADRDTGEYHEDLYELGLAHYNLRQSTKGIYALFKQGDTHRQQLMACWYSRHRLDHIWAYRKSRLIRKVWAEYLEQTRLYEHTTPMHLVLTVPHRGGRWRGKSFYAREMLTAFNQMRKNKHWKRYIFAGEYGLEVSKAHGSENGLHIHLHCLVFMRKEFRRKPVYSKIKELWKEQTGAQSIHFETLYVHRKDAQGRWIVDEARKDYVYTDSEPEGVAYKDPARYRKKYYLNEPWFNELPETEQRKQYVVAILEAIKYHFKNDALKNADGTYNIPLIAEVLEHSKYLRMYSKFGAFYGEKRLNYSNPPEPEEPCVQEPVSKPREFESEEEYMAYLQQSYEEDAHYFDDCDNLIPPDIEDPEARPFWADGPPEELERHIDLEAAERNLVNPFTGEPAGRSEYERYLAFPERMAHQPRHGKQANVPKVQAPAHYFQICRELELKTVMKYIATGEFYKAITAEDYPRFKNYINHFNQYI